MTFAIPGGLSVVKIDFVLSIIIGLAIFLTDLAFGWLTYLISPIPVIFIIAIIIGIIAGTHGDAVIATMLTWIGGIVLGMMLAPIIFAEFWNPEQTLLGTFIFVFIYSVRGFYRFESFDTLLELLVVGLLQLLVALIITPVLYLVSFAFAPVGVLIGKFIRTRTSGKRANRKPEPQQTPVMTSTPVEEQEETSIDDNEEQSTESEF